MEPEVEARRQTPNTAEMNFTLFFFRICMISFSFIAFQQFFFFNCIPPNSLFLSFVLFFIYIFYFIFISDLTLSPSLVLLHFAFFLPFFIFVLNFISPLPTPYSYSLLLLFLLRLSSQYHSSFLQSAYILFPLTYNFLIFFPLL